MSAPAALVAVPLVAGVVAGAQCPATSLHVAVAIIAAAWLAGAIALALHKSKATASACVVGCVACGFAIGARAQQQADRPTVLDWFRHAAAADDPVAITGVLREDAARTENGVSIAIDITRVEQAGLPNAVSGGARIGVAGTLALDRAAQWRAGRTVALHAALREAVDYGDPGVPSDRARLARQGVALLGSAKSGALVTVESRGGSFSETAAALRASVRRATADAVGHWSQRSAGVVTAILIGDRTGLQADDERRLQDAGTYHVIAISGENIALLIAMIVAIGRGLRLPIRGTAGASILLLVFYGYLTGLAPSVLRATVAGVVFLTARSIDHRGSVLNALSVAAAFAAVSAPLTVFDPGFLLSFGATLAILVAVTRMAPPPPHDRAAGWWRATCRWMWTEARGLDAATLCAEIALMPIAARLFGRVTFAGLVLNFVAIPLMSVIEFAGLAAVAVEAVWRAPALACGWLAHLATAALIGSASLVDAAPRLVVDVPAPAMWVIVLWYVAWTAVLTLRRRTLRRSAIAVIIACGALILGAPVFATAYRAPGVPRGWTRVAVFDVGQGDATLVWPSGDAPLLVDAGGAPGSAFDVGRRVTVPTCWAFGVRRLGTFVLTHGDPDHIGGAPAVIRALTPREVWEGIPVPRNDALRRLRAQAAAARMPWIERRAGVALQRGPVSIRVLNPPDPEWERQKVRNDDSIVLEVRVGDVAFLLPGDVSRVIEPAVLARFEPAPIVIVKAPHHGSAGSSSQTFVDGTHPVAVIFSAGKHNPFGHPSPLIVDRYRTAGAQVFSTAGDGAVVMDTDGREVDVWNWSSGRHVHLTTPSNHRDH